MLFKQLFRAALIIIVFFGSFAIAAALAGGLGVVLCMLTWLIIIFLDRRKRR